MHTWQYNKVSRKDHYEKQSEIQIMLTLVLYFSNIFIFYLIIIYVYLVITYLADLISKSDLISKVQLTII